jgi:hypothetical protein
MATSTIVFTYTVGAVEGTGEKELVVSSATVDGSAYAALTAAEKREMYWMCKKGAEALLRDGKTPDGGWKSARDITA